MRRIFVIPVLALVACALTALAHAQTGTPAITVSACGTPPNNPAVGSYYSMTQDTTGKLCTAASVSATATFTGFTPTVGATANLAVTTTSADVALPAGVSTVVTNTGAADAYFRMTVGAGTAVTTDFLLKSGAAVNVVPGSATHISAITSSGSTSLNVQGGSGSVTGYGGGGASGGSGGAVYGPTAVGSAAANPPVLLGGTATGGATGNVGVAKVTSDGLVHVSIDSGGGSGGTSSSFAAAFPSTGTAIGAKNGSNMVNLAADASNDLLTGAPSGAYVDGWDATTGAKADSAYAGSGSASVVSVLKGIYANSAGSIPAGSAIIGKVGIDQTTPGTTNGVQDAATSATGSAVPSKAGYVGAVSSGNLVGLIQADASQPINVSTATTTQIVALSSGKKIYVTSFDVVAGGTGNITFVYGTGTNCGTGTTSLTGAYNLTAQAGIAKGNGLGAVLVVPASNALCVTTSAAVQMSGSVAYTQF